MKKRKIGLLAKFIVLFSAIVILTSAVLTGFFVTNQAVQLRSALKNRGVSLVRNLAYNAEYGVLTANTAELKKLTDGLVKEPDVVYALVQDAQGQVLAFSGITNRQRVAKELAAINLGALKTQRIVDRLYVWASGFPIYDIAGAVRTFKVTHSREEIGLIGLETESGVEEEIGAVRVGISLVTVNKQIATAKETAIVLTCIVITMGIIMALFLVSVIVSPLKKLSLATTRLAQGDLTYQVRVGSYDEIGDLAASFNLMTQQLKKSKDKIDEYNRTLEQKVQERTKQLRETQAQMLQSAKMAAVGQLGAGVAHELNNPLAGVLGYAQFIMEKVQRPDFSAEDFKVCQKYVQYIEKEATRCKQIVENLLRFSRKPLSENQEPVNIARAMDETLAIIGHQLKMKNVTLTVQVPADIAPVMGITNQLQQVFTNTILNAQQSMPEGGSLTISIRNKTDGQTGKPLQVVLEFSDTGCGIPEENLSRIFEPFFTTKERDKGTGLGLAISYQIIQDHKGSIDVKSKVGSGTTFTITLPALDEKPQA